MRQWVATVTLSCLISTATCGRLDDSHFTSSPLNTTHPADRSALLGLLEAITIQGSQTSLPWDPSVDPCGRPTCGVSSSIATAANCHWEGISCEDYRVTSLELHGRGLSGHISGHICRFDELKHIDLSGNSLTGLMPHQGACQQLPSLLTIDLSNNQLTGPLPFTFASSIPKLTMLDLSHNSFSGSIPRIWGNFSSLELIDISHNNIMGTIPQSLTVLQSLRLLVLDYNCSICGKLARQFRERVVISVIGTNIGSSLCRIGSCRQKSTSVDRVKIGVSVSLSALFCFLGAWVIARVVRRRSADPTTTEDVGLKREEKPPLKSTHRVGSLVLMPGDGDRVFIALPLSQPAWIRASGSDEAWGPTTDAPVPSSDIAAAVDRGRGTLSSVAAEEVGIPIDDVAVEASRAREGDALNVGTEGAGRRGGEGDDRDADEGNNV